MSVQYPPESPRDPRTPHERDEKGARRPKGRWLALPVLAVLGGLTLGAVALDAEEGRALEGASSIRTRGMVTEFSPAQRGSPVRLSGSTLGAGDLSLETLRGEIVVLNVWGSWCPPCREEAPVLAKVAKSYADRGVSFLGINVRDNPSAAIAFERRYGVAYPSLGDPGGRLLLTLNQYIPANAVPVTLILDRQGRVASRILGAVTERTLTALLQTLIAEPSPPAPEEPSARRGR